MSAHGLLILLHEFGKRRRNARLAEHFISFLQLLNLIIQDHECKSYFSSDIRFTLRSYFCRTNVIILSLYTQRCYGRHYNVSRKYVNH